MVIAFIPVIFQFVGSPQKTLMAIGWLMLFLLLISYYVRRIAIGTFQFEELVTYGGPFLLLLACVHLRVSESRKNRPNDAE